MRRQAGLGKTVVHLFSGGMDSTVLLYDLLNQGYSVHCLLFDYKQRHIKELKFAKWHCKWKQVPYTLIHLPQLKGSELTDGEGGVVIPNRNAIFLSIAVNVAVEVGAGFISFAANKNDEESFPDCRRRFVNAMNASIKAAGYDIVVLAPYLDWLKWKIAGWAREMGAPISETWSCYRGEEKPCGKCLACEARGDALK